MLVTVALERRAGSRSRDRARERFRGATSRAAHQPRAAPLPMLFADFPGPIVFGFPTGHVDGPAMTMPLGVRARLVAGTTPRLVIEEAAVAMKGRTSIGICGTAMATLAALLKQRGFDVQGSDQGVYPPMSDFLAAEGIRALRRLPAGPHHIRSLARHRRQRDFARQPRARGSLDRKIRYCSLPEAIREHFLWGARSIVIAGTHGKTTTTSLTGWLLTSAGVDPTVLVGGIARNFGPDGSSYRSAAGSRLRHRGRRVRQRVLRQDRQVPEVPAGHRRHQQHRVRPRGHLRRPRRRQAGVSSTDAARAANRDVVPRRRQRARASR